MKDDSHSDEKGEELSCPKKVETAQKLGTNEPFAQEKEWTPSREKPLMSFAHGLVFIKLVLHFNM